MKNLTGTYWRHKKTRGLYMVESYDEKTGNVRLIAFTLGCKSTNKYAGLLAYDYEPVALRDALPKGAIDPALS